MDSGPDTRSANGSAGVATGMVAATSFFFSTGGGPSLLGRPSGEVRLSEGVESDPLPDALRARREGGLRAAPRDLVCT